MRQTFLERLIDPADRVKREEVIAALRQLGKIMAWALIIASAFGAWALGAYRMLVLTFTGR